MVKFTKHGQGYFDFNSLAAATSEKFAKAVEDEAESYTINTGDILDIITKKNFNFYTATVVSRHMTCVLCFDHNDGAITKDFYTPSDIKKISDCYKAAGLYD